MFRLVLSGINSLVTEWVVMEERVPSVEGWMTLQHMGSVLITIPVAESVSWLG